MIVPHAVFGVKIPKGITVEGDPSWNLSDGELSFSFKAKIEHPEKLSRKWRKRFGLKTGKGSRK
jgi:hypothetical protein